MNAPTPTPIELLEARIAPAGIADIDLSTLDGTTGFKLSGVSGNDGTGRSVRDAGDVNGDGFGDVIIGAPAAAGEVAGSGASYVVFGKAGGFSPNLDLATLNGTNGFRIGGVSLNDSAGYSVSGAGDVNGDGFGDLIVGAPRANGLGVAYVIFGKASGFTADFALSALNGTNGFRLSGPAPAMKTGYSVSGAGDVNGDGFADIIIGDYAAGPPFQDPGSTAGAGYVVFGKATGFTADFDLSTLDGSNGFRMSGLAGGNRLGACVSDAGDVNGDGFADILISAPMVQAHGKTAGATYVIFGKAAGFAANFDLATLNGANGFKMLGGAYDYAGYSVNRAGDVNGDGFGDVIVGGRGAIKNGVQHGVSYVVFGKAAGFTPRLDLPSLNGANGFKLSGGADNTAANAHVSGVGDINGDGVDDLIVNAAHITGPDGYFRRCYVVFGKLAGMPANVNLSKLSRASGFQINDPTHEGTAVTSLSGAGDVNGDGLGDVIVGASVDPHGDVNPAGVAYVVFGKAASSTYAFRDTDGDRVKIIASQGVLDPHGLVFSASGMGRQLDLLDLTGGSLAGADLTIKVAPRLVNGVPVGDGRTNVGKIDASGMNLGTVTIAGDLTEFHGGDGSGTGVQTLNVTSLGKNAALFPALTPRLDVAGRVGQLTVARNVTDFAMSIGAGDAHGVGLVQIGGNLMDSTLGVGAKIGQLTVGGSIVGSTVRAPGALLPANTTAALAIGTISVTGSVTDSDILAGYDAAGNASNGDAGIGTVTIKGSFAASNLVAGIADATHDGFGQNDSVIPGGSNAILATIARLTIKGTAKGSAALGDFFGITAAFFGAAKIHGSILALTNQPTSYFPLDSVNNDLRLTVV